MNEQLRKALAERCKDMGLTKQAIDRLTEIGGEGLSEEPTEEEITAAADKTALYAKAMQSEVTRKTSSGRASKRQQSEQKEGEDEAANEGENKGEDEVPQWAKQMQKDLADLRQENANLKAEKAKSERASAIAEKAKKLGIPDYLMKRVSIADDADIDKELTEYKQDLVNNGLAPMEQGGETGSSDKGLEAEAEKWLKDTYGIQ